MRWGFQLYWQACTLEGVVENGHEAISRPHSCSAVIGSILPDVFLALGFMAHYGAIVTQSPLVEALHTLLHHSALHTVTVSLHSFVVVSP